MKYGGHSMSIVNSFAGFGKLNEVWLGGIYPVDFYYDFESEIRDAFDEITEITNQDLDKIQKILQQRNIKVQRPTFSNNRDDYYNEQTNFLIKPPIMPRDTELSLGQEFYHIRSDYKVDPWQKQIDEMIAHGTKVHFGPTGTDISCLSPPSVVRCGKDIYVDINTHEHVMPQVSTIFVEWSKNYRVHLVSTGGHSDGVFCPVAKELIVSTHWLQNKDYSKTFPNWEIYNLVQEFPPTASGDNNWWVPNSKVSSNSKFSKHIEQRALDWVGNYRETQFSANMLVLDDNTVLAVNQNSLLTEFLNKKGIEVILADFRAKSFWDGGMHCLTCDINRSNDLIDYFPHRPNSNYLDWLL
jgi:hypothetical protein